MTNPHVKSANDAIPKLLQRRRDLVEEISANTKAHSIMSELKTVHETIELLDRIAKDEDMRELSAKQEAEEASRLAPGPEDAFGWGNQ